MRIVILYLRVSLYLSPTEDVIATFKTGGVGNGVGNTNGGETIGFGWFAGCAATYGLHIIQILRGSIQSCKGVGLRHVGNLSITACITLLVVKIPGSLTPTGIPVQDSRVERNVVGRQMVGNSARIRLGNQHIVHKPPEPRSHRSLTEGDIRAIGCAREILGLQNKLVGGPIISIVNVYRDKRGGVRQIRHVSHLKGTGTIIIRVCLNPK